MFKPGSAANGQSSGLDEGCGLQKVPTAVLAALLHGAIAVLLLL